MLIIFNKINLSYNLLIVIFTFFSYALIGFIDDYLIIKYHNNKGLSESVKLLLQIISATIVFYLFLSADNEPLIWIHTLNIKINIGFLYGFFILLVLTSSSNAVNLTDGLDGLAAGLSAIAFIAFSLISLMVGYTDMGIFTLVLTGSLLGFLVYNGYPAKVFMGDTGSLALGAVMGTIAIITHREVTLLIVAFVFVIETLSVIIQVFWYKTFKKRLFLMTPIHHHFQKLGWSEVEIVRTFWVVRFILAMAGIVFGVWI